MATWLVTGGAGFIGSNFVRLALRETQHRLVVVDALTYAGHRESLTDCLKDPRTSLVEADIADGDAMASIFHETRPAAVVHLAAESHVDRSIDSPRAFVHTNVAGTLELLEASRAFASSEDFRFLHVSTDEVFGSLGESGAFREDTPYAPRSPYSASKAAADHLVRAYYATYGLPVLLTNCSNNYGPYQFPEKLIPLALRNALEGRPIPIYGDGQNVRDWLYVEDHVRALLRVLEAGRPGASYNVGGRCERSNLRLIDELCAALEKALPAAENPAMKKAGADTYAELKSFVEDRAGHDRRYAIDPSRVENELGWRAETPLATGLERTVRWYLENAQWCKTVEAEYRRERLGRSQN